jgi:hypothetical protein
VCNRYAQVDEVETHNSEKRALLQQQLTDLRANVKQVKPLALSIWQARVLDFIHIIVDTQGIDICIT